MKIGRRILTAIVGPPLALALVSCARSAPGVEQTTPTGAVESVEADPAPLVPQTNLRGLEVQLWVVNDFGGEVARALKDLDDTPDVLPGSQVRDWRESGLRIVSIPAYQVDSMQRSLPLGAPVRREWIGQSPAWRPIAQGPPIVGERVRTSGGGLDVDEGAPRLLARAWVRPRVVPGAGAANELRLELVPQIVEPRGRTTMQQIESRLRGVLPKLDEDGPVLSALSLEATLDGSTALIIVGESVDADWDAQAAGAELVVEPPVTGPTGPGVADEPGEGPDDQAALEPAPSAGGLRLADPWETASGVGPRPPEPRTLGESMLSSQETTRLEEVGDGKVLRPRRRALLVLVPRVSGTFEIVPSAGAPPGG